MDTNDWSFDMFSYKLKTARQKRRLQKEDFDKQLIQLHKKERMLWKNRRALPMIPLEQPYQKGWKRFFVLREDVRRCNKAEFYQQLLDKINTVQYSNDKNFKAKKKRKRKYVYETKQQSLQEFYEWEWNSPKLKITEKEKQLFYPKYVWCECRKTLVWKYVFIEPWRFVLKVKPHMITETKMIDEVLEQEIKELDSHIINHHLRHKIYKLTRGKSQSWKWIEGELPKYENPFKNKPFHAILDEIKNEY